MNAAHRRVTKLMADAGIDGVAAAQTGVPLTTIAAVLGHADVSTTAIGAEARELVSRAWDRERGKAGARTMGWYTEPANPAWEVLERVVPSEWLTIENDDEHDIYITALHALNLPTGPLGDWHTMCWQPPAGSGLSTRTAASERCCELGVALWGRDELVDARGALQAIGHPDSARDTPVWAASHPRAVAEMVIESLTAHGRITNPDIRSARRWLQREQRETCARLLEEAGPTLGEDDAKHLTAWIGALCAEQHMTHVD